MQNIVIGGLLLCGGILVSLGNNKTQGTILLLTLLLIVSISILTSLQPSIQPSSTEYFEENLSMESDQKPEQPVQEPLPKQPVQEPLPKPLPLPLTVEPPKSSGSEPTEKVENNKTGDVLKQPPNPPFNKIMGYADNTIESIKFYDTTNKILNSGTSQKGKEFSYECANGGNIVGYDYNSEGNARDDTSILGGLGPVYCADGSILDNVVGKQKNNTLGQTTK